MLPVGKLPLEHLRSLLRQLPKLDPRLLIGPETGEDAAVIDAGDRYLVVATDPVTVAPRALPGFFGTSDPLRHPEEPSSADDVGGATCARPGSPPITQIAFSACRAQYPGGLDQVHRLVTSLSIQPSYGFPFSSLGTWEVTLLKTNSRSTFEKAVEAVADKPLNKTNLAPRSEAG